jgi:acetyl esterase/lipase
VLFLALWCAFLVGPDVDRGIVYREVAGERLELDFYRPVKTDDGPSAAVVVIHGGAWVSGKRQDMEDLCRAIAAQGVAAASVSYRLAPKHRWPAMLEDAQAAVRFLRANAARLAIDPARMGAAGGSAGGHLALLLGFTDAPEDGVSSRVQAVLNIFGPTDLSRDFDPVVADQVSWMVIGKKYADANDEIRRFSPVNHVDKHSAPVFTVHGTDDKLVPVQQAKRLEEAMSRAGVHCETVLVDGMGHAVDMKRPEIAQAIESGITFLMARLAGESG